jgi:hypothetical protein
MRKLLRFLALFLSLALFASGAQAAVKAGSACSKLGSTSTVSGKKYTCIKSGKKLVWNKGVVVVKPTPAATPSATPTPTPTATSTPTPTPSATPTPTQVKEDDSVVISRGITYRYINGTLERQAYASGKFFNSDSRKSQEFDPIRVKAYEEIRAKITNAAHPNFVFKWDVKPGFPSETANFIKDYSEAAASFWGWVFKEQLTVPAQLVTELDLEWQKTQELKFSDTVDILNIFTTSDFKRQKHWVGGGGHYWHRSINDPTVYSLLSFQTPSYASPSTMKGDWVMVAAHEVTHIIQDYYRKGIPEPGMPAYDLRANGTFQEGSATLFGYAIGLNNLGWYSDGLDEFLYSNFKNDKYWKPIKTVDDVIKVLEETEARTNNSTHQSSYSVGALLYEWVIAKYGFDSYIRILENLPKNANYSDTVKAALGISKAELYKEAAPYILAAFDRIKL